jgi:hypothetical protein
MPICMVHTLLIHVQKFWGRGYQKNVRDENAGPGGSEAEAKAPAFPVRLLMEEGHQKTEY